MKRDPPGCRRIDSGNVEPHPRNFFAEYASSAAHFQSSAPVRRSIQFSEQFLREITDPDEINRCLQQVQRRIGLPPLVVFRMVNTIVNAVVILSQYFFSLRIARRTSIFCPLTAFIQCATHKFRIYRLLQFCCLGIMTVSDIWQITPQLFQQVDQFGSLLLCQ